MARTRDHDARSRRRALAGVLVGLVVAPDVGAQTSAFPDEDVAVVLDSREPGQLALIEFAPGSADLDRKDAAALVEAASWIKERRDHILIVEGHTDRSGSAGANRALAARRAERVLEALLELGVEPYRVVLVARGEDEPLGTSPAENRRVVVRASIWPYHELVESQRQAVSRPPTRSPPGRR